VVKRSSILLACLALWLLAAGPALATTVTIQVGDAEAVDVAGIGGTYNDGEVTFWWLQQDDPDDGTSDPVPVDPNNPYTGIADIVITGMSAVLKEDPFVTSNISFINPTAFTQTYTITVNLPIAPPFDYNATIASSVGVTVTDGPGGGVTASAVAPEGIFEGLVNGGSILTLLATSVTCATNGCTAIASDNTAVPQLPATPGSASSIGIQLKFTLTPGDQVGITSRFEIIEVPEPGFLAVLGIGLIGLVATQRRAA
jgi:hypothetical protein